MPIINSLKAVQDLVSQGAWDFGSRKCRSNAREMGYTRDDVAKALLCLEVRHFKKQWPNAETDYGVISADAYVMEYDDMWLYIKLGIRVTNDEMCVIASFHTTI